MTSGLSPAVGTALGLLTTGALGTVAYGYLANSDSDLATSASSYAYVRTIFKLPNIYRSLKLSIQLLVQSDHYRYASTNKSIPPPSGSSGGS